MEIKRRPLRASCESVVGTYGPRPSNRGQEGYLDKAADVPVLDGVNDLA